MHCTTVSGRAACAPGNSENGISFTPEPTSGSSSGGDGGGGLSTGAKAGIGVGVAVVACAILGALGWFCLIKRRRAREPTDASSSSQQASQQPPHRTLGSDRSPAAMSEVTSDITRTSRLRGLTQDYFGPAAVPGPYTDPAASAATSPGTPARGVPLMAHSPNDITAPVEIDSRLQEDKDATTVTTVTDRVHHQPVPESTEGRFELYSEDTPVRAHQPPSFPSPIADSPTYGDAQMRQSQ